jgi:hypothetical protein
MKMSLTIMTAAALAAASTAAPAVAQNESGEGQRIGDDSNTNFFYTDYDRATNNDADWRERTRQNRDLATGNYFYRTYDPDRDRQARSQRSWDQDGWSRDWDQSDRDMRDRRRADDPRQMARRHGSPDSRVALDREGAAIIGYDLDADGESDVFYTVTRYELEMIRQRAGEQRQMDRQARDEAWASGRTAQSERDRRMRDRQAQRQHEQRLRPVSGEVISTREFRMAEARENNLFARIRTDNGKKMVLNLGPASRADRLDLRQGDDIKAMVTKGTLNERVVPVAHRVRHDGRTMNLHHARAEDLKRLQGRVVSVRHATLENRQGKSDHMMVRLRTDEGTRHVCLGNPQRVKQIEKGDQIAVLAAPGSIDGRPVYMAKRVNVDGRMIRVSDFDQNRRSSQRQQTDRQRSRDNYNR